MVLAAAVAGLISRVMAAMGALGVRMVQAAAVQEPPVTMPVLLAGLVILMRLAWVMVAAVQGRMTLPLAGLVALAALLVAAAVAVETQILPKAGLAALAAVVKSACGACRHGITPAWVYCWSNGLAV